MKIHHAKPVRESWVVTISGMKREDRVYLEEVYDQETRSIWGMKQPLKDLLENIEHHIDVDRGDFGEGAEVFLITLYHLDDLDRLFACLETLEKEQR